MTSRKVENHDAIFGQQEKVFPIAECALFGGMVLTAALYLLFGR